MSLSSYLSQKPVNPPKRSSSITKPKEGETHFPEPRITTASPESFDFSRFNDSPSKPTPLQMAIFEDDEFEHDFNRSEKPRSYNRVSPEAGINVASLSSPSYLSEFSRPHASDGWLCYSKSSADWKQVYVILTHYQSAAVLQIYTKKDDFSPTEVLFMRNCAQVSQSHQKHGNPAPQHQFKLFMHTSEIGFATKSLGEYQGWISSLQHLVATPLDESILHRNDANPQLVSELETALERVMERMVAEIKNRMPIQSTGALSENNLQKDMEARIIGAVNSKLSGDNAALESQLSELSRTMESRTDELSRIVNQVLNQQNESSKGLLNQQTESSKGLETLQESFGARSNELKQIKNSIQDFVTGQQGSSSSKAMMESNLYGDIVNQIQDLMKTMGRTIRRESDQHAEDIHPKLDNLVEMTEFITKTQSKLVDLVTGNSFGSSSTETPSESNALCDAIEILNSKMQESSDNVEMAVDKIEDNGLSIEKLMELQNDYSTKIQAKIASLAAHIEKPSGPLDKTEMTQLLAEITEKTSRKSISEIQALIESYSSQTVIKSTASITTEINRMMRETARQTSSSPTPNPANDLILSMNQKILTLTSLCEQMRASQTGRMQSLEERIKHLQPQQGKTEPSPQQENSKGLINGIEEIESKLGRMTRDNSANHDVNQAWFTRVHELSKNVQREVKESRVKSAEQSAEGMNGFTRLEKRLDMVQAVLPKIMLGMEELEAKLDNDSVERSIQTLSRSIESLGKKQMESATGIVESLVSEIQKPSTDITDLKSDINKLQERLFVIEKMGEDHQTSANSIKMGISGLVDIINESNSPQRLAESRSQSPDARSPSPSSTNQHLVRLTESIHSTLVSYLPMDNSAQNYAVQQSERKLDEIIKLLERGNVHAKHQPGSSGGGGNLEACYREVVEQNRRLEGQLDSINAGIERIAGVDLKGIVRDVLAGEGFERKMVSGGVVSSIGGKPLPQPPSRS